MEIRTRIKKKDYSQVVMHINSSVSEIQWLVKINQKVRGENPLGHCSSAEERKVHHALQRRLTQKITRLNKDKKTEIVVGGHVLFVVSCFPCSLPVWPVITEWLSLSADYRWPCVDPFNLQSNHMMAPFAPQLQASGQANHAAQGDNK